MHEYGHVILSINCWEQGLALIENNLWAERPISTEKRHSLLRYAISELLEPSRLIVSNLPEAGFGPMRQANASLTIVSDSDRIRHGLVTIAIWNRPVLRT